MFELLNKKNFSLPLAVGLHLTRVYAEVDIPTTIFAGYFNSLEYEGTQFGLGATFGFRYILNSGFYFAARVKSAFDFIGKIEPKTESNNGYYMYSTNNSATFVFTFSIGAGYQFK